VNVRRVELDVRWGLRAGDKLVCGVCTRCGDHVRGLPVRILMGQYCGTCDRGLEMCFDHPLEIVPRKEPKRKGRR